MHNVTIALLARRLYTGLYDFDRAALFIGMLAVNRRSVFQ